MNKNSWVLGVIAFALSGCIEPFTPQLNDNAQDICVVSGGITNLPGYQTVIISKAASVTEPMHIPLTGCQVFIDDDKGNVFTLDEYTSGRYHVWIDKEYLTAGISYRVRIIRPSGEEIQSDFDRMPSGPDIDTLHYVREQHADKNGNLVPGLQFYVSFKGTENDSRFYHWSVEETFEYHSPYPIDNYYDGTHHNVSPSDYSLSVCWKTQPDPKIYNLSTKNLTSNGITDLDLHFIDNTTTRLYVKYSVLIGQHALSEPAYQFWELLRINSESQGGLYERQPLPVEGNLHNLTDPSKKVLGFFSASTLDQKRLFIDGIRDMGIEYDSICSLTMLGPGGWRKFTRFDYPVYYNTFRNVGLRIIDADCIDCRKYGGTLIKPDFWPN